MAELSWVLEWIAGRTPSQTFVFFLVLTLLGCYRFTFSVWKVGRRIKKLCRDIEALQGQARERASESAAKDTPVHNVRERLEAILRQDPYFEEASRRFAAAWRDSCIPSRGAALGDLRFEDFLPFDELLTRISNRRLAQVVPGMLVALGILGTFLGLVVALPSAGPGGMTLSDLEGLRQAVGKITGGLGLAFWTSIWGISCSLLFLGSDRSGVFRLERNYWWLVRRIGEFYPALSPPEVASLTYQQLKKSCVAIEQMGTDLATKLADTLGAELKGAFQESFAPHADRVEQAVASLVNTTAQAQLEALSKLVDRFFEQAGSALGGEFERLQDSMRLAGHTLEELRKSIEGFGQNLAETAAVHAPLLDNTARAGEALVRSLDRLEAISVSLDSSAGKLTVASRHIDEAATAAASSYQIASEGQKRLLESLGEQVSLLEEARQKLLLSWGEALTNADGAIQRIRDITKELETGVADHLLAALKQFDSALSEALGRFGGALTDLQETVEELPNVLLKIEEAATLIGKETDMVKEVLGRIEAVFSSEMFGNVERAAEIASRLENVVVVSGRLLAQSEELQDRFTEAARALAAHSSGTQQATVSLDRVENAVKGLNSEMMQMNLHLQGLQKQFDGSGNLGQLRQSLEMLSGHVRSLSEQFSAGRKAFQTGKSGGLLGRLFGK